MVDEIRRALEAILMVADEPLEPSLGAEILEIPASEVEELCKELSAGYEVDGRGFLLARVAGGWRFQSHPDLAPYVERFVLEGQSARLSAAALESLAIVAYKQPITRAQVAAIRGVNVEAVMRTLEQRGYIAEVGRDPGPGQAVLFGTTRFFLERLGLDSLDQLPSLSEFVPGPEVVEALEQGLRPDREAHRSLPDEGDSSGEREEPVRMEDRPGEEPSSDLDGTAGETDSFDDAMARLDANTERLDALVDEVRHRLEEAEAAVRSRDEEDGDPSDEVDERAGEEADDGPRGGDPIEAPTVVEHRDSAGLT